MGYHMLIPFPVPEHAPGNIELQIDNVLFVSFEALKRLRKYSKRQEYYACSTTLVIPA